MELEDFHLVSANKQVAISVWHMPVVLCTVLNSWSQFHLVPDSKHVAVSLSHIPVAVSRLRLKCDGTREETRFHLSPKRTSPFKSAGVSVQSTAGRRAVHISLQGLYCSCKPVFCSHVTLTGYPLHSLVSSSLFLPCVTVCHHISNAVYSPELLMMDGKTVRNM
jgi:hypothetical protein